MATRVENRRNSDGSSSLKWEDFFGETSSADELLPSMLDVYETIAKRSLSRDHDGESGDMLKASTMVDVAASRSSFVDGEQTMTMTMTKCGNNDPEECSIISEAESRPNDTRPSSFASNFSSSSLSSAISSRMSVSYSGSSTGTESLDRLKSCERHLPERSETSYLASAESLDNVSRKSKELDQESRIPRIIYTTASQYSEDSGVFSSLVRSESSHARSYCLDESHLDYTSRVILEIIETEAVYVNDLQQIVEGYLDEWKTDVDCQLTNDQIHELFGNIEEIYNFSKCFLRELQQCGADPVKVAKSFVENNASFSIYANYCTNYPRSMSVLTELMRQEETANMFRERQMSLHHTLPLGSYLLKPVQRILKYHLLLQNMVKHSSVNSPGYSDVTVALSTMTGIAHHINNMKRRHEHAVRVQEVQSLLIGWEGADLTVYGELYAEGTFHISGVRASRHIFLFEHMLLVTKKKEGGMLHYKMHIMCSDLMLVECIPKEPFSFQIIPFNNPRLQFTVHARSLEEKRYWTLELKRVILENYNAEIPSHARQLVMELGQNHHLDDVPMNRVMHRRQHSTPEYLERRKMEKNKHKALRSRIDPLIRKSDIISQKIQNTLWKLRPSHENNRTTEDDTNAVVEIWHETGKDCFQDSTISLSFDEELSPVCSSKLEETSHDSTPDSSSYDQKEKAFEEIINQLLTETQKFKNIDDCCSCTDSDLPNITDICDSDTGDVADIHNGVIERRRISYNIEKRLSCFNENYGKIISREEIYENLQNILKYVKQVEEESSNIESSCENLSNSLTTLVPTSPIVWLKQQNEHLASPTKKADSLPRTFQVCEDEWKVNRPKTIASDKPQMHPSSFEEGLKCSGSCILNEIALTGPIARLGSFYFHPECKFYNASVNRSFKKVITNLSTKLSVLKFGPELVRFKNKRGTDEQDDLQLSLKLISYSPGSSKLGARIANGTEIPDYADPKVLFPTITPSRKAAALLGVRHCAVSQDEAQFLVRRSNCERENRRQKSDSFYERKFEESEVVLVENCRNSVIVNNDIGSKTQFASYTQLTPNISLHKPIKIPPPVPLKPAGMSQVAKISRKKQTTDPIPTRGWVRQVVEKFQTSTNE